MGELKVFSHVTLNILRLISHISYEMRSGQCI